MADKELRQIFLFDFFAFGISGPTVEYLREHSLDPYWRADDLRMIQLYGRDLYLGQRDFPRHDFCLWDAQAALGKAFCVGGYRFEGVEIGSRYRIERDGYSDYEKLIVKHPNKWTTVT